MQRILVPTDFSPTAEKAFRFALDMATKAKGIVILYHVYTPVESPFIDTGQKSKQYNTQTETNLVKRLQRLKKKVTAHTADVPVSTIVGRSPVIDNILGFAEHNHIDLIVMGTQGASGLKKIIIGSVAARIVEKTDIPVLLVPEKFEWTEPERIVFITNYLQTDRQALSVVLALAKLYGAALTVVHLVDVFAKEEKEKIDFDNYAHAMHRELNQFNLRFKLLKTSSVTETMENLYKEIPYDIVAMVRRKKSFLKKFFVKSFTQNMAYVTNQPLLVVPEEE